MEDTLKHVSSTGDPKGINLSPDDGIDKDFLTSWKLTTDGNDALDFTTEAPHQERKKPFNFAKLDDFDFGDDFSKISSFKMDMSDLDFCSPQKKTVKPKERSKEDSMPGKNVGKQNAFSFNFDFNELEGFGLESNLLKDEKLSKSNTKGQDHSNENDRHFNLKNNNTAAADIKDTSLKKLTTLDEGTNSNHESSQAPATMKKQAAPTCACDDEPHVIEEGKVQQEVTGSKNPPVETGTEAFPVQHDIDSSMETCAGFQAELKQDKVGKPCSSPDLRGSSTVQSFELKGTARACAREPQDVLNISQTHIGEQDDITSESIIKQSAQGKTNAEDAPDLTLSSMSHVSNKLGGEMKGTEDSRKSDPKIQLSSLHRESNLEKFKLTNIKGSALQLQLKPLTKSEATGSPHKSLSNPKQICALSGLKLGSLHIFPVNMQRESGNNAKPAQPGDSPKSFHGEETKKGLSIHENDLRMKNSCTTHVQSQSSTMPEQDTSNTSRQSTFHKIDGFASNIKPFKASSFEKLQVPSVKGDRRCVDSNMKVTGLKEMNNCSVNPANDSQSNSKRISVLNVEVQPALVAAPTITAEKHALLSPSLKRKLLEGSNTNLAHLNPLKRVSGSLTGRRSSEALSKIDEQLVTNQKERGHLLVSGNENMGDRPNNVSLYHQASKMNIPAEKRMTNIEILLPVEENNGNAKKAEAYSKELDDICSMLKKEHEKAKELLVHAIANNNSLLLLKHPMYEEKVRGLRRLATDLLSKKYEA